MSIYILNNYQRTPLQLTKTIILYTKQEFGGKPYG